MKKIAKFGTIKSIMPKKAARIILWVLISFLILRGIVSIIRPNQSKNITKQVTETLSQQQNTNKVLTEATAFAENFGMEYFTYKQGQTDEYRKRLSRYMSDISLATIATSLNGDVQALSSTAISHKSYKENSFDIDVKIKVKYLTKDITKDVFIRVPIASKDNKYIVEDVPVLVSGPTTAEVKNEIFNGTLVDTPVAKSIQDMLNNFLKVYCEGNEGEIKYYLSDSSKSLRGLDGNFKFKSITEIRVFTEVNGDYLALISYSLEDVETKQEIKQRVNMTINNKDNRYYIKDIEARNVNLKQTNNSGEAK